MQRLRAHPGYAATVALSFLQPLLLLLAGDLRPTRLPLGIAVYAFALLRLARGSRAAWLLLLVLNALPVAAAVAVAGEPSAWGSGIPVMLLTGASLLAALLSPSMRRDLASARAAATGSPARPLPS